MTTLRKIAKRILVIAPVMLIAVTSFGMAHAAWFIFGGPEDRYFNLPHQVTNWAIGLMMWADETKPKTKVLDLTAGRK